MTPLIRPARAGDIPALVRLRLTNARRHTELDPAGHRLPDTDAVREYFADVLSGPGEPLILVAEVSGEVTGMAELVVTPDPPGHQILVPRRTAQIHTVVLDGKRGQGLGKALISVAERLAAGRGISFLIAPILAPNTAAIGFYTGAGFAPHGVLLSKKV
jgi:GNAT superfamily N-acetyltransferase